MFFFLPNDKVIRVSRWQLMPVQDKCSIIPNCTENSAKIHIRKKYCAHVWFWFYFEAKSLFLKLFKAFSDNLWYENSPFCLSWNKACIMLTLTPAGHSTSGLNSLPLLFKFKTASGNNESLRSWVESLCVILKFILLFEGKLYHFFFSPLLCTSFLILKFMAPIFLIVVCSFLKYAGL